MRLFAGHVKWVVSNLSIALPCPSIHIIELNRRLAQLLRSSSYLDALHLFEEIHSRHSHLKPDSYTLSTALTACAKLRCDVVGRQLHSFVVKSGFNSCPHVVNALLSLYGKLYDLESLKLIFKEIKDPDAYSYTTILSFCSRMGDLDFAFLVFVDMRHKDVTAWNGIITGCVESGNEHVAMVLFRDMCRCGVMFDNYTLASVLHGCSTEKVEFGMEMHSVVVKTGFMVGTSVVNALITMYFRNGAIDNARRIFDEVEDSFRDSITYNVMMGGLASVSRIGDMRHLFVEMLRGSHNPNELSFLILLSSCFDLVVGLQVHCHAIKMGFESCTFVCNAAITMYSNCRECHASLKIFYCLQEKDLVTWNAIISSVSHEGLSGTAFIVFRQMRRELVRPDEFTFGSLLIGADSARMVDTTHACIVKFGLMVNIQLINALVTVYSKHGKMKEACVAFLSLTNRNLITWNSLISGFISNGLPMEAMKQFSKLLMSCDLTPDKYSLNMAISICSGLSALRMGKQVHSHILVSGFGLNVQIANNLISFYAKCGHLDWSWRIFDTIPEKDIISWNALIAGFAHHGKGLEAVQCFEAMEKLPSVKPDNVTLTLVLCACTHAGLIDAGKRIFNSMVEQYGIKPEVGHISAIVNLLGRGGHFNEMETLLASEHVSAHPDILLTMLNSCTAHGNLELARKVSGLLAESQKDNPSTYVLLSNAYAAAGEWEEAGRVRNSIDDIKTRKQAGYSWIGA